jgi:hypothetical protein
MRLLRVACNDARRHLVVAMSRQPRGNLSSCASMSEAFIAIARKIVPSGEAFFVKEEYCTLTHGERGFCGH